MSLQRISYTVAVIFLVGNCSPIINQFPDIILKEYTPISFCDLPNHEKDTVYIRGIYSGHEEYWSFDPIEKKCKKKFNVYLDLLETPSEWPSEIEEDIKYIHENYSNGYLILDVIGVFETGEKYGHLGSNSSRFIVQEIVSTKRMYN